MNRAVPNAKPNSISVFAFCVALLNFFTLFAHAQYSDRQLRDHIRGIWKVSRSGASDQKLNSLLQSKYPGTSVSWRSVVSAVYTTNVMVEDAKRKPVSSVISLAIKFGQDQLIDEALKNVEPPELKILRTAVTGLYSSLNSLASAAEKAKLSSQIDRYFLARQSGLTKVDIINQQGNVEYDDSWIVTVGERNSLISRLAPPAGITPRQAWDIGEFLWDLQHEPKSFALEKQKIGENLRNALSGNAASQTGTARPIRVAFVVGAVLMTQPVAGGSVRQATEAQGKTYRARNSIVQSVSPNGRYRVEKVGADSDETLRVVKARDRKQVFLISESEMMGRVFFDGWLPDSQHIALWNFSHIAGANGQSRYAMNIETGRIHRFNGWISPDGGVALVVGKEGKVEEVQGSRGEAPPAWYRDPPLSLYTAKTNRTLSGYRFTSARREKLMLNGKPFAGLDKMGGLLLYPGFYDKDLLSHPRTVEFSGDNRWALVHSYYYKWDSTKKQSISFSVDYLVEMATGKVRKLAGIQAKFI